MCMKSVPLLLGSRCDELQSGTKLQKRIGSDLLCYLGKDVQKEHIVEVPAIEHARGSWNWTIAAGYVLSALYWYYFSWPLGLCYNGGI